MYLHLDSNLGPIRDFLLAQSHTSYLLFSRAAEIVVQARQLAYRLSKMAVFDMRELQQ